MKPKKCPKCGETDIGVFYKQILKLESALCEIAELKVPGGWAPPGSIIYATALEQCAEIANKALERNHVLTAAERKLLYSSGKGVPYEPPESRG